MISAFQLLIALRPRHWAKNCLVLVPLIFGNKLFSYPENIRVLIAAFIFTIAAGAVYVVNDILDIDRDKIHPVKCRRPVASGKLEVKYGYFAASILMATAVASSFALNIYFGLIIMIYFLSNVLYSKIFKNMVIIDVLCIGVFFLLRIAAGSVVADVKTSPWIVSMTLTLSFFLAFCKRHQEILLLGASAGPHRKILTAYGIRSIDTVIVFLAAVLLISYPLYTFEFSIANQIKNYRLTYTIPFVFYGIYRYLFLIYKLNNKEDPIEILFTDKHLHLTVTSWIILTVSIIYFPF